MKKENAIKAQLRLWIDQDAEIIRDLQLRKTSGFLDLIMVTLMTLLGTHTMFLLALPMLFWLADPLFARHMTLILGQGVIATNYVKDLLCLPRPASPPVVRRLHVDGSTHPHEYGFPSTHSSNAASIVSYVVYVYGAGAWSHFNGDGGAVSSMSWLMLSLFLAYAFFLPYSRVYCGMHSFPDVIAGTVLGLAVTMLHVHCLGPLFDVVLDDPSLLSVRLGISLAQVPYVIGALGLVFYAAQVFILHPSPVDPCPCYDDSVCNAGVGVGVVYGLADLAVNYPHVLWFSSSTLLPQSAPFLLVAGRRMVIGTVLLLIWRQLGKSIGWTVGPGLCRLVGMPVMSNLMTSLALKNLSKSVPVVPALKRGELDEVADVVLFESVPSLMRVEEEELLLASKQLPKSHFVMHRYSLEMLLKMLIYTGIGVFAVDHIPRLFVALGI